MIGYPDDNMLWRFTNQDLDWWWTIGWCRRPFDDCLDGVAKKLANDVLEMAQDVGKGSIQMTVDHDVRQYAARTIGLFSESTRSVPASLYHFTSVATQEDFSDKFRTGIDLRLGVGKVPWGVECFGQCKVLLGDDPARNSLAARLVSVAYVAASGVAQISIEYS